MHVLSFGCSFGRQKFKNQTKRSVNKFMDFVKSMLDCVFWLLLKIRECFYFGAAARCSDAMLNIFCLVQFALRMDFHRSDILVMKQRCLDIELPPSRTSKSKKRG